ncbi:MAG: CRISPR-associated protein Cas5 [Flexistipes sinusarabici]|uniref:CRISPR-associated protein Cas5 n=1 Tax=Flexistipes sinusarabici TaxID=2352 RepID=A0A5D0MMP0_FLESI|nr:CRISPR-associated protein Cas5 [Flexistipes sinusarabici]TYB32518.1 MAG: CRISPR-associated protein Cas5 [Flexistipes sinusarabici]
MYEINEIIKLELYGKFAHFRKFYTNASSQSYFLPPKTTIMGILGSILELPRDDYYDLFNKDHILFSIAINKESNIRKVNQSLNYISDHYFNLLVGKKGKVQRTQCKFELLTGNIIYDVYLGLKTKKTEFERLKEKISEQNLGFGISLGQKQFKGSIVKKETYAKNNFEALAEASSVDSSICRRDILELNLNEEINIIKEDIPFCFKKIETGREIQETSTVIAEKNGKRLNGTFKNMVNIKNDLYLSFF